MLPDWDTSGLLLPNNRNPSRALWQKSRYEFSTLKSTWNQNWPRFLFKYTFLVLLCMICQSKLIQSGEKKTFLLGWRYELRYILANFWYAMPTFQYPINSKWIKWSPAYIFSCWISCCTHRNTSHYRSREGWTFMVWMYFIDNPMLCCA